MVEQVLGQGIGRDNRGLMVKKKQGAGVGVDGDWEMRISRSQARVIVLHNSPEPAVWLAAGRMAATVDQRTICGRSGCRAEDY